MKLFRRCVVHRIRGVLTAAKESINMWQKWALILGGIMIAITGILISYSATTSLPDDLDTVSPAQLFVFGAFATLLGCIVSWSEWKLKLWDLDNRATFEDDESTHK